jgi:hypothetical protein
LNAGTYCKGVEHRLDEPFRATGIDDKRVRGLGGRDEKPGDEPGSEEQKET